MTQKWLGLLAGLTLTGCGGTHFDFSVGVQHKHDAAFLHQLQLLQASSVKVAAVPAGPQAVLEVEVREAGSQPQRPDTLRQRVHKLARLLAADVVQPEKYQAVTVRVTERTGFFKPVADPQFFIYPFASLR